MGQGALNSTSEGVLIVVEGIDGSGKSTQIHLLHQWLASTGHRVFFSEWNSSNLVKGTTRLGKKRKSLTPTTFSLIHATDFADRTEHQIIPALKAGAIVLADRYVYTAFARDAARGVSRDWVRNLYSFSVPADIALYFRVPLQVSLDRILAGRAALKHYEAGMDIGLSDNPRESFKLFQAKIMQEYEAMVDEFGLTVIDGTQSIEKQQALVRSMVAERLARNTRSRAEKEEAVESIPILR
jgi:dTMP kinase